MEVVKAEEVIDDVCDDKTIYQFTIELIEVKKILISVFNIHTGITFKTYISEEDEWFKSNIYIFHGDCNKALTILTNSLVKNIENLPHVEKESNDELIITIQYEDDMFPFHLSINIPKFVSKNGPLEDRVNSLEYQVRKLKDQLKKVKLNKDKMPIVNDEIYDSLNNVIYKGEIKNGKPHGKGIRYCNDSMEILYEGEFKDGYYDGEGTLYHYSGGAESASIKHNSIYDKGSFCKGLKHGSINQYNMDGVLICKIEFTEGLMNGIYRTYFPNGQQSSEINYIDGKEEGLKVTKEEITGKVRTKHLYKNGLQEGVQQSWNGFGLNDTYWMQLEWEMVKDKNHGYHRQYDNLGTIISEQKFKDGRKIS